MSDKQANFIFTITSGVVALLIIILCWCKMPSNVSTQTNPVAIQDTVETLSTVSEEQEGESLPNVSIEVEITEPTVPPIPTVETIRTPEFEELWHESAIYMAKTIWGEARGCSAFEQQRVAWCILNRVDSSSFPETIIQVITQPSQFHGYSSNFPVEEDLYELSMDIIAQWQVEKSGGISNRILGKDYVYFSADGTGFGNIFRTQY